jgi:hypothetical protein
MDDEDNAAWWAALELEQQHQQLILASDPDYQLWLDRLNYQAEIERVQLRLDFNSHTH